MSNVTFDAEYSEEDYLAALRRNFAQRAKRYDSGELGNHHRELLAQLLSRHPPEYPVLDIACGTGMLAAGLPEGGRGVTGVDVTQAMLDQAAAQSPEARWLCGRAEELPLPDNAGFSTAYICAALVYFTDIPKALREAFRVLRPGGRLAYQAVTNDSYVAGIALQAAVVEALGEEQGLRTFRLPHNITDTREDNERLMREAGFVEVEAELVTVKSGLRLEDPEAWWARLLEEDGNPMTARVRLLLPDERERVRCCYLAFLERRRNADMVLEEKVSSWYVAGRKPR